MHDRAMEILKFIWPSHIAANGFKRASITTHLSYFMYNCLTMSNTRIINIKLVLKNRFAF